MAAHEIPIAGCESKLLTRVEVAEDTMAFHLFASCRDNKNMIILSATDGHIITDLPIGNGSDGATFNPATMEAFSSQGDGTLTVVKEDSPTSFSVEQTVATPQRAKVLTLDTKTNHPDNCCRIWPRATSTGSDARHDPGCRAAPGCSSLDARTPSSEDPELFPDTCDRKVSGQNLTQSRATSFA